MECFITQSRHQWAGIYFEHRTQTVRSYPSVYLFYEFLSKDIIIQYSLVQSKGIHFMVCNFIRRKIFMSGLQTVTFLIQQMQSQVRNILPDFSLMNAGKTATILTVWTKRIKCSSTTFQPHLQDVSTRHLNKAIYLSRM